MKTILESRDLILSAFFIIFSLFISRIIPHPPNFTPILASAIFAPYVIKSKYSSIVVILIAMFISDLVLGLHKLMVFIYIPILIILLFSDYLKYKLSENINFLFLCILGPLIFFIISNFGVWLVYDYYTNNLIGLLNCYILAIPFFKNTLFSTVIYLIIFVLLYKSVLQILNNNYKYNLYWPEDNVD